MNATSIIQRIHIKRLICLPIFLLAVFSSQIGIFAQSPPADPFVNAPASLAKVRSELIDRINAHQEPSFAVAVIRDGKVIWGETLGWADREAGIAATPETRYAVASVSKSITATGALAMIGKGKFQLDSAVNGILGSQWALPFDKRQESIKVSQLLDHTSGIPHLFHYEYADRPDSIIGTAELIRSYGGVVATPGERYLYTNLGFGVLARVIEITGRGSFQTILDKELFAPLRMPKTTTSGWLADEGYVRGYSDKGTAINYRFRLAPDGGAGFFTTLNDITNYTLFHLGEKRFPQQMESASISTMMNKLPDGRFGYAQGWGIVKLTDSTVFISDGQMAGGTAAIVLVPEKRVGVVVMCNKTGGPSDSTAVKILSALIPDFEGQFGAAIGEVEREIKTPVEMPKGVFEGTLGEGDKKQELVLDLSDTDAPVVAIEGNRYLLQKLEWERGMLLATAVGTIPFGAGKGKTHNLNFTLWPNGSSISGFVQEELMDERPQSGVPYRLSFKARMK